MRLGKVRREALYPLLETDGTAMPLSGGERQEAVPRHREINERLAKQILARARK
jgi:hypothetical protein